MPERISIQQQPNESSLTPYLRELKFFLETRKASLNQRQRAFLEELEALDNALKEAESKGRSLEIDLPPGTYILGPPPGKCPVCGK